MSAAGESGPAAVGSPRIEAPSRGAAGGALATVGVLLALVGLVFAVFHPALDAGFVNWDDDLIITGNRRFRGLSAEHLRWMATTFYGGHWEPVAWLSLAIDHELWGLEPRGFHLTPILLHALNACLVFAVARTLFPGMGRPGAALSAALFAVHPLRVESVAWVTERRDVLSATFFLTAAWAWARHARRPDGPAVSGALVLSLAAFAVALGTKAAGIAWPVVFLLLSFWPLARFRSGQGRRIQGESAAYLALALAVIVPASMALEGFGATAMGGALTPLQRGAQAVYGAFFYAARTVVPLGLSPLYLLDLELDPFAPRYLGAAAGVSAITLGALALGRRRPALAVTWFVYLLLIGPFLGLASNGIHLVADRYAYVACLPFALLAGGGLARLRAPGWLVGAILVGVLGLLSRRQVGVWESSVTLWDRAVEVEPDNYVARVKRAAALQEAGDLVGADADLTHAIEVRPAYTQAWIKRGVLRGTRDPAGAVADFSEALRLRPRDPELLFNRGQAHLAGGDRLAAIADLEAALAAAPPRWPYRPLVQKVLQKARAGL